MQPWHDRHYFGCGNGYDFCDFRVPESWGVRALGYLNYQPFLAPNSIKILVQFESQLSYMDTD
jgi:hypothetical protein